MTGQALTKPVFTGTLNSKPLRFFAAPLPGLHLVWHAIPDLHACLSLPRSLRRHFQQSLQRDYAADVATVATADGILTIAPHWMAQGLIDAAEDLGRTDGKSKSSYAMEAVKAWNAMNNDLPSEESVARMLVAFRNSNKTGASA